MDSSRRTVDEKPRLFRAKGVGGELLGLEDGAVRITEVIETRNFCQVEGEDGGGEVGAQAL